MGDLLFLAHRIPYPPDKGDKVRSWPMLRHLASRTRVHLGALVDDPADMQHVPFLRELCASVALLPLKRRIPRALRGLATGQPLSVALFQDPALKAWVDATVARHPITSIFIFSGQMAPYALPHVARRRTVMDLVDLDSEKWRQYAQSGRGPQRLLYAREARRLLAFERHVARTVDASLFVSAAEADLFRRLAGAAVDTVHALPNGVDERFSPSADFPAIPREGHDLSPPLIVFTGAMDYRPNIDAVAWFAAQVWPRVRAALSAARFFIVGSKPAPQVQALARQPGIAVTGRVEDTRPYIAAATVAVAPLRIARGIQNKVLEAMAMARPVVASPQAHEGIDAEPGRHLLVEADPARFADAVVSLARDTKRAAAIGEAARAQILARYQWATNLALLDTLFDIGPTNTQRAAA